MQIELVTNATPIATTFLCTESWQPLAAAPHGSPTQPTYRVAWSLHVGGQHEGNGRSTLEMFPTSFVTFCKRPRS